MVDDHKAARFKDDAGSALITGAGSGVGRHLAARLGAAGYKVTVGS